MIRSHLHPSLPRQAFTLVELLVVITVIGILMGLLLPAVSSVTETARSTKCKNNLKQIGVALRLHCEKRGVFPTGGTAPWPAIENYSGTYPTGGGGIPWGPETQGLGWAYQILPYLELETAYNTQPQANLQKILVSGYFCPSRRRPTVYQNPSTSGPQFGNSVLNDYASATPALFDQEAGTYGGTPKSNTPTYGFSHSSMDDLLRAASSLSVVPPNTIYRGVIVRTPANPMPNGQPGSIQCTSPVALGSIQDGLGFTMMAGEKAADSDRYYGGTPTYDDRGWSDGWSPNTVRSTGFPPMRDQPADLLMGADGKTPDPNASQDIGYSFGSPHPAAFNAVFADGQVRPIKYNIDVTLFNSLGDRADNYRIDETQL